MEESIVVPDVGEEVEEMVVGDWRVRVGARVSAGDVLVDLESEKATFEVRALSAGHVVECRARTGDVARVGDVLGVLSVYPSLRPPTTPAPASADARSWAPPSDEPTWEVRVLSMPFGVDRFTLDPGWEPFGTIDSHRLLMRRRVR